MIYETPPLNQIDEGVLDEISVLRERLRLYLHTPRRWYGPLRRNVTARAIRGSTAIEGYSSTVESVTSLVEGDETVDEDQETLAALKGYRDAMTFVLQVAADWPPIDSSTLRALHYMMTHHDPDANPGNWRPGMVWLRDGEGEIVYIPPDRNGLEYLIDVMTGQLAADVAPPLVKAAMAHLNLTLIHPFRDGNGRMARCLQTFVLGAAGITEPVFSSIEEYLGRHTSDYYRVLAEVGGGEWSPERDARPWIEYCLTAHYRQARHHLRRIEETEQLWEECEILADRAGIPERTVGALCDAARGRILRRAAYQRITELTTGERPGEAVATRDLAALVKSGLLNQTGEARSRRYPPSPALRKVWAAVAARRRLAPDPDPYERFGQTALPQFGPKPPGLPSASLDFLTP